MSLLEMQSKFYIDQINGHGLSTLLEKYFIVILPFLDLFS